MYLLCIFVPPVAVLLKGKPIQALINLLLCICLWIPAVVHAFAVVNKANADKRHKEMVKAIKENNEVNKNEQY